MKKSEQYTEAMIAVLRHDIPDAEKLEIIETLMNERKTAEWREESEKEAAI